jgi:hypothetical protein
MHALVFSMRSFALSHKLVMMQDVISGTMAAVAGLIFSGLVANLVVVQV